MNPIDILRSLIYTESNYIYINSTLGSAKLKYILDLFYPSVLDNFLFFYSSIKNQISFFIFFNKFSMLLHSLNVGYRAKYRIIGLGWKSFYYKNFLLFKLGYSHLVFFFLPFELSSFKKKKKKTYYTIVGLNDSVLKDTFFFLKNLRIPDIYSMNGVFSRVEFVEFREGKKSFLL